MKEFNGYKRGINLGGWLSQCEHTKKHYETFISEEDIKCISQWGLDHIRVPIDYELVCSDDGVFLEDGFMYIDRCIEWCGKYNLNMILDLHKTLGYSFDETSIGGFFYNEALQQKFILLWEELAKRYGKYYNRLAFELLNEVVDENVTDIWNGIVKRVMPIIREYAAETKVIVGGARNNSVFWVKKLDLPYDENVVYTFHYYEPLIFTHQSAYWVDKMTPDFRTEYPNSYESFVKLTDEFLPPEHLEFYSRVKTEKIDREFIVASFKDAVDVANERDVALYCGEYGVIDRASLESSLNWYTDIKSVFDEYNIGHAAWTYRGKDFGITDKHYEDIRDEIIKLL